MKCLIKLELTHFCIDLAIQLFASDASLDLTSIQATDIYRQNLTQSEVQAG